MYLMMLSEAWMHQTWLVVIAVLHHLVMKTMLMRMLMRMRMRMRMVMRMVIKTMLILSAI